VRLTLGAPEPRKGVFDDLLAPAERDTAKTAIGPADKTLFERTRLAAEVRPFRLCEEMASADRRQARLHVPKPAEPEELAELAAAGPSTRPLRSQAHLLAALEGGKGKTKATPADEPRKPLRIRTIRFGDFDIATWFDAPFPEEYNSLPDGRMWICEFCLKYMKSDFVELRHRVRLCAARRGRG
jgi:hypothetical protein